MLATFVFSHQSLRINCKPASIRPTARLNRYSALPLPCLTGITNIHIPDCTILVSPPKPLNFPRVSLVLFDIHFELYSSLLAQVSNCTHLYKLIALLAWQLAPAQLMSAYLFDHSHPISDKPASIKLQFGLTINTVLAAPLFDLDT